MGALLSAFSCGTRQSRRYRSNGRLPYFILPSAFWHSANASPSAKKIALGKAFFVVTSFTEWTLPNAALGKAFAECNMGFAECLGHSAKHWNPVVILHQ